MRCKNIRRGCRPRRPEGGASKARLDAPDTAAGALAPSLSLELCDAESRCRFSARVRLWAQHRPGAAPQPIGVPNAPTGRGGGVPGWHFPWLGCERAFSALHHLTSKESLTRKGRCRAVAAGVYPRFPQLCAGGGRRRPSRGRPTRTQVENGGVLNFKRQCRQLC